jgi:hypothetical protein
MTKTPSLDAQIEEVQRAIENYPQLERMQRKSVVEFRIGILKAAKRTLEWVREKQRQERVK